MSGYTGRRRRRRRCVENGKEDVPGLF